MTNAEQLKLQGSDLCVMPEKNPPTKGEELSLGDCGLSDNLGVFILTDDNELGLSGSKLCIEARGHKRPDVILMKCAPGGAQTWMQIFQDGHQVLYSPSSGKCLAARKPLKGKLVTLDFCSRPSTQAFVITNNSGA